VNEERIDFIVEIGSKGRQGQIATFRTDVTRREQPGSTLLTDLASQTIALTLRSPITWDVHSVEIPPNEKIWLRLGCPVTV
jgi:hypothetical protein